MTGAGTVEDGWWAWLPAAVPADTGLSSAAKLTYCALATWGGCPEIRPSVATIAARAGLSIRAVRAGLRALEAKQYISTDPHRGRTHTSLYTLLLRAKGGKPCRLSAPETSEIRAENRQETSGKSANAAAEEVTKSKTNSKEGEARRAWSLLMEWCQFSDGTAREREARAKIGPRAWTAWNDIGGYRTWLAKPPEKRDWLLREFIAQYNSQDEVGGSVCA